MELYILVENGKPLNHPLLKENVEMVYPDVDFDNLPNWLAKFERVPAPMIGPYEKNQRNEYELVDGVVKDVWYTDPMTPEEILEKQNQEKEYWSTNGFPSWTFDESQCAFVAPVDYPNDGNFYIWNEEQLKWDPI